MAEYHFIYENKNNDTCHVSYQSNDLDHAWEQWRNDDRGRRDEVLMIFVGTVEQILYQE